MPVALRACVLVGLVACLPEAAAQPSASPDPVPAVRAAVTQLFDAMRTRDTTAVRSAFHPAARLATVVPRGEQVQIQEGRLDRFVEALAASDVVWDERVGDVEVRVDDALATAWMPYRFYAGAQLSHCGVNAMQLVRSASGWQIVQITDTRRTTCG